MKYYLAIAAMLFFACENPPKKQNSFFEDPPWVKKIIAENNCKEEYDYAKLIVNISSYNETCVSVFCPPYNHDQETKTGRMNQFRIQLDTSKIKQGMEISGDTISFYFSLWNRNSCFCADGLAHYPGYITLIKDTKELVWVNHGSASIRPLKEDIEKWLNDSLMLNYVKHNKDSIDPWFYNELEKRGHLK